MSESDKLIMAIITMLAIIATVTIMTIIIVMVIITVIYFFGIKLGIKYKKHVLD